MFLRILINCLTGRIDVFLCTKSVEVASLYENFTDEERNKLAVHPKPLISDVFYYIASKKLERNKQVILKFNSGLKELKETGRIDQIMKEGGR